MSRPEIKEILLLHHSHLDVGYTHSQPILWELQNEYINQVLDWLEETEGLPDGARPKWTCEATEPVLKWLNRSSASQAKRFVKHCRDGRLGLSALRWHTTALANRAGLNRLLDGKRELEQLAGVKISAACQHDVNGVPWPMADVLLDGGVDFFVMGINSHLGRAVQPRPGMFLWEAPSGRKIRVWNGNHYTMFDQLLYSWEDSVSRMAEGWAEYEKHLETIGYPYDFFYLTTTCSPVMWDNAPNNPYLPDLIRRWNEAGRGPKVRYATFDDLRARASVNSGQQAASASRRLDGFLGIWWREQPRRDCVQPAGKDAHRGGRGDARSRSLGAGVADWSSQGKNRSLRRTHLRLLRF